MILGGPKPFASIQRLDAVEVFPQVQARLSEDICAAKMGASRSKVLAIVVGRFHLTVLEVA